MGFNSLVAMAGTPPHTPSATKIREKNVQKPNVTKHSNLLPCSGALIPQSPGNHQIKELVR